MHSLQAAIALGFLLSITFGYECPQPCECSQQRVDLFVIDCSHKNLTSIPTIPQPSNYTGTILLNLDGNCINDIGADSLGNITSLSKVTLRNNSLVTMHRQWAGASSSSILELDLSHNNLSSDSLQNSLTQMLFELNNLEVLRLDNCSLANLTIPVELKIKTISMAENLLTLVPDGLELLPSLEELLLRDNQLPNAFPSSLKDSNLLQNLTTLDLSGNLLQYPPKKMFLTHPNLQFVNMSHCVMTGISQETFSSSTNIQYLDLSYNQISSIGQSAFIGITNNATINLGGNSMIKLYADILAAESRDLVFDFRDNPFECDCDGNWLIEFAENNTLLPAQCSNFPDKTILVRTDWSCDPMTTSTSSLSSTTETPSSSQIDCPVGCNCYIYSNYAAFYCTSEQFDLLPEFPPIDDSLEIQLYLSNNAITELGENFLGNLTNVPYIHLASNSIVSVHPNWAGAAAETIETLILGRNQLSVAAINATLANLANLRELDVSYNQLDSLDDIDFKHSPNMLELFLDGNMFSSLNSSSLQGLSSLKWLSIQKAGLTNVSFDAFEDCSSTLEKLDLNGNTLTSEFLESLRNMTSLARLNLAHNMIEYPSTEYFSNMKDTLVYLNMSDNPLQVFPTELLNSLSSVTYLFLDGAQLTSLEFTESLSIKHFSVSYNSLTQMPSGMELLIDLMSVSIAGNQISTLPDDWKNASLFTSLTELDFSENLFWFPPRLFFQRHPAITKAIMKNGRMTGVGDQTFAYSKNLYNLDLSNNALVNLGAGAFAGLPSYSTIDLSDNQIQVMYADIFPSQKTGITFVFSNNPFYCDCSGNWIISLPPQNVVTATECINAAGETILSRSNWTCSPNIESTTPTTATNPVANNTDGSIANATTSSSTSDVQKSSTSPAATNSTMTSTTEKASYNTTAITAKPTSTPKTITDDRGIPLPNTATTASGTLFYVILSLLFLIYQTSS